MQSLPSPRNYGLSQRAAITVSLIGAGLAVAAIVVAMLIFGLSERTAPAVLGLIAAFGSVLINLSSAIKSAEAADSASKTHRTAAYAVSQNAAIEQAVTAHCGEICPAMNCPLRQMEEGRVNTP